MVSTKKKKKVDVIDGNPEGLQGNMLQRKSSFRDPEMGKNLTRMKKSLE